MIEIINTTHPFTPPMEGISGNHFLNYLKNTEKSVKKFLLLPSQEGIGVGHKKYIS